MAAEAQILTILNILVALHLSGVLYKSTLFMQNKPNLPDAQMNLKSFHTVDYENKSNWKLGENKANTKPIKPNFQKAKMNVNIYFTKVYDNILLIWSQGKQTQSNPTCSELVCPELACGELVEPVEGVEPISNAEIQPVSSSNSSILSDCLNFCKAISSSCRTLSLVKFRSSPICWRVFFFFLINEPTRPK